MSAFHETVSHTSQVNPNEVESHITCMLTILPGFSMTHPKTNLMDSPPLSYFKFYQLMQFLPAS